MSIENSFDNKSKSLLSPDKFLSKYKKQYKTIIVTFSYLLREQLLKDNVIELIDDIVLKSVSLNVNLYKVKDEDILVLFTLVGAPITVGFLEELRYIFDFKNIVFFGSAGILDKSIKSTDLIIPSKAYRDEGTSYHYKEASDFIDIKKSSNLQAIFDKFKIPYKTGYTWSTDAFYRETVDNIAKRKSEGCVSVEMEISAIEAFADFYNVNFYPFIYGADKFEDGQYFQSVLGNLKIDYRIAHFEIAKLIAKNI